MKQEQEVTSLKFRSSTPDFKFGSTLSVSELSTFGMVCRSMWFAPTPSMNSRMELIRPCHCPTTSFHTGLGSDGKARLIFKWPQIVACSVIRMYKGGPNKVINLQGAPDVKVISR